MPAEAPARQVVDLYLQSAGLETGYGFFAPTVAGHCKLIFQVFYADEGNEIVLPSLQNESTKLRLFDILERLDHIEYPPLREMVLRATTSNIWAQHPEAIRVRAIFARSNLPTLAEYRSGRGAFYEPVFAYDYERNERASP